jgi:hypothetical protein
MPQISEVSRIIYGLVSIDISIYGELKFSHRNMVV